MEAVLLLAGVAGIGYVVSQSQKATETFSSSGGGAPALGDTGATASAAPVKMENPVPVIIGGAGHNNMVPFIRGSGTGAIDHGKSTLDNYTGMGESVKIKRDAVPFLGDIRPDAGNPNGMPVMTDFAQSRIEGPIRAANYFPEARINVGPGVGFGYDAAGHEGYQQARTRDAVLGAGGIRTTDELRTADNPKLSYHTDPVPGAPLVKKPHGPVDAPHRHPDKFWESGPERWFTTIGVEHGPAVYGEANLKDQNRDTTEQEHFGGAAPAAMGAQSYIRPVLEPLMTFFKLSVGEFFGTPWAAVTGSAPMTYDYFKFWRQNISREENEVLRGPVPQGSKTYAGVDDYGRVMVRKDENMELNNHITNPSRDNMQASGAGAYGTFSYRPELDPSMLMERVEPGDVRNILAKNPYQVNFNPVGLDFSRT